MVGQSSNIRKNKFNLETTANHIEETSKSAKHISDEILTSGSYEKWLSDFFVTYRKNGFILDKESIDLQYANHLDLVDGPVTTASGVRGGHNVNAFMTEVYHPVNSPNKRVAILSNIPSNNNGWSLIEYKLYKADPAGNPILPLELQNGNPFIKTVYDPQIISEQTIKTAGYKAFKDAIDNGKTGLNFGGFPNSFEGLADGIQFTGFFNTNTNKIVTWYVK
ncbi:MAG: hypothetical protein IPK25_08280 [Saprospiraceae bacterium]|nr:hypothetical protein [Saprospiraceae bacterium]